MKKTNMPPESDGYGMRVVGCSFDKAVIDPQIRHDMRLALSRIHEATIYVTELINFDIRLQLEKGNPCPQEVFDKNKIVHAFQSVLYKNTPEAHEPHPLFAEAFAEMPRFSLVCGNGLTNACMSVCSHLATVATNNVWMHFRKRVFTHVKLHHQINENDYKKMSKSEKKSWKLELHRICNDLCLPASEKFASDSKFHEWIRMEKRRLGLENANATKVYMSQHPEQFVKAMYLMSIDVQERGGKAFSLYPLRRGMVTKFVELDNRAVNEILQAMRNERMGRKRKQRDDETYDIQSIIDFRKAGVYQGAWRQANTISTDGVSLHLKQYKGNKASVEKQKQKHNDKMEKIAQARKDKKNGIVKEEPEKKEKAKTKKERQLVSEVPVRGIFAIDQLKNLARTEFHLVSLDPGKHELFCAVDSENAGSKSGVCRYTSKERREQLNVMANQRRRQYGKDDELKAAERNLSQFNSRSPSMDGFKSYCENRRKHLVEALKFYGEIEHRQRRRKTAIRKQKADLSVIKRLSEFQTDERPLVLAYGSWGLSAGKTRFKGIPPCIGVTLMRTIAKHFPVVITPEHYTSKICYKCDQECGAHPTMKRKRTVKRKDGSTYDREDSIRGLRVCQNETCKQFMNRDRLGAFNIGRNFERLFVNKPPLRSFDKQEKELHALECSLCENED